MTRLVLDGTSLTSLAPSLLSELTRLEHLSFRDAKQKVGMLPNLPASLKSLNAEQSGITGVLGALPPSLSHIYLEHNELTDLPSMEQLSSLRRLELSFNKLTTMPIMPSGPLYDPSPLSRLEASNNLLTDFHDTSWVHLERLLWLDLSHNALTTVPKLYKTKDIFLSHNKLTSMSFVPLEPKFDFDWYGKGMYVWISSGTCEESGHRSIKTPQECSNAAMELSDHRHYDLLQYLYINKGKSALYTKNEDSNFPPWCSNYQQTVYFNDARDPTRANTGACNAGGAGSYTNDGLKRCYCKRDPTTHPVSGSGTLFDESWLDDEGQFLWSAYAGEAGELKHMCHSRIKAKDRTQYGYHGDLNYASLNSNCQSSYFEIQNEDYRLNNDRIGCGDQLPGGNELVGQTGDWNMWQRLYFNGCIGHIDVSFNELKDLSSVPAEAPTVGWVRGFYICILCILYDSSSCLVFSYLPPPSFLPPPPSIPVEG